MSYFGLGLYGGNSRCYDQWMDVLQCLSEHDDRAKCKAFAEDYIECLHHRKEYAKQVAVAMEAQKQKKEAEGKGGHH